MPQEPGKTGHHAMARPPATRKLLEKSVGMIAALAARLARPLPEKPGFP